MERNAFDRNAVDLPSLAAMLTAIISYAPREAYDEVAALIRPQLGERAWSQLMAATAMLQWPG